MSPEEILMFELMIQQKTVFFAVVLETETQMMSFVAWFYLLWIMEETKF